MPGIKRRRQHLLPLSPTTTTTTTTSTTTTVHAPSDTVLAPLQSTPNIDIATETPTLQGEEDNTEEGVPVARGIELFDQAVSTVLPVAFIAPLRALVLGYIGVQSAILMGRLPPWADPYDGSFVWYEYERDDESVAKHILVPVVGLGCKRTGPDTIDRFCLLAHAISVPVQEEYFSKTGRFDIPLYHPVPLGGAINLMDVDQTDGAKDINVGDGGCCADPDACAPNGRDPRVCTSKSDKHTKHAYQLEWCIVTLCLSSQSHSVAFRQASMVDFSSDVWVADDIRKARPCPATPLIYMVLATIPAIHENSWLEESSSVHSIYRNPTCYSCDAESLFSGLDFSHASGAVKCEIWHTLGIPSCKVILIGKSDGVETLVNRIEQWWEFRMSYHSTRELLRYRAAEYNSQFYRSIFPDTRAVILTDCRFSRLDDPSVWHEHPGAKSVNGAMYRPHHPKWMSQTPAQRQHYFDVGDYGALLGSQPNPFPFERSPYTDNANETKDCEFAGMFPVPSSNASMQKVHDAQPQSLVRTRLCMLMTFNKPPHIPTTLVPLVTVFDLR